MPPLPGGKVEVVGIGCMGGCGSELLAWGGGDLQAPDIKALIYSAICGLPIEVPTRTNSGLPSNLGDNPKKNFKSGEVSGYESGRTFSTAFLSGTIITPIINTSPRVDDGGGCVCFNPGGFSWWSDLGPRIGGDLLAPKCEELVYSFEDLVYSDLCAYSEAPTIYVKVTVSPIQGKREREGGEGGAFTMTNTTTTNKTEQEQTATSTFLY